MMKVLFLDFDGVLNTDSYQVTLHELGKPGWDEYGQLFDPEAVANLKRILDTVPEVRIVVESSWKANGIDELRLMWKERKLPGELYDATPIIFNEDLLTIDLSDQDNIWKVEGFGKSQEVSAWLKTNNSRECQYVILDDVPEFQSEHESHLVITDPRVGITLEDAERAISILLEQ